MLKRLLLSLLLLMPLSLFGKEKRFPGDPLPRPTGVYVGATAGLNWVESFKAYSLFDKWEEPITPSNKGMGYVLSGAFGYRFSLGLRPEIEIAYRRNNVSEYERQDENSEPHKLKYISETGYLFNLYYDFPSLFSLMLYVGGGVGYNNFGYQHEEGHYHHGSHLCTQVVVGISTPLSTLAEVGLEYRYFQSEFLFSESLYNHTLALSLRGFFH